MKRPARWLMPVLVSVLAGALALGAVACSDDNNDGNGEEPTATEAMSETAEPGAQMQQVDIVGKDYSFDAPESIAGGLTQINFKNASAQEDHVGELVRLNDGVTFDEFTTALASVEAEADAEAFGTLAGGPGAGPGGDSDLVLDLDPGQYVLLCFVPNPEGVPHFALGMIQELEVTEAPAEQPEPPVADVTVGLSDFAFDLPDTLPAGPTTLEVVNNGPQIHEMALVKVAEGLTYDELTAAMASEEPPPADAPPPFTIVGADVGMSVGEHGYVSADLSAGTYALLCFVTDPDTGAPHFALGMVRELTVE